MMPAARDPRFPARHRERRHHSTGGGVMLGLLTSAAVGDAPAPESIQLRVLSLGASVQSTTLALMATHGEVGPIPDCAIFSDTGWEPRAVYEHPAWLISPNVLPFSVHIVSAGNIRADLLT